MKTTRSLLLALATFFTATSLQATTVIAPTFDELVAQAQLIFQGSVTDVQSQWTGEGAQRHIVTYVTVKIEEALKGDAGASYTLRMLGGTVDGQTMEVTDTPKFKVGDRDILFVENNGSQFVPLVGIAHGRFHVQSDKETGAEVVVSEHGDPVGDLAQLGKADLNKVTSTTAAAETADSSSKVMAAADFKAAVKAKLASVR